MNRVAVALGAPLASGLLLWLSSPAIGVSALAWVALVPAAALALARPETRAGRTALPLALGVSLELQLVPALPFGLARNQWGDPPVPILVGDSPVLVVALLLVPLAVLALVALRFPQPLPLARPATAGGALAWALVPAALWTALDAVRALLDPGGLWGPLFLSQAGAPGARLAALAGPWLVTFALAACGFALAAVLVARPRRVALAPLAVAAALVAPVAFVSLDAPDGETVRVAAVQPGYDTAELDRPVNRHLRSATRDLEQASLDLVADLAPLTREAAARGAELVVWPEATVWVDPRAAGPVRAALARLARETRAALVVPYFLRNESAGATVVVSSDGRVSEPERKHRPMWFLGERAAAGDPEPVAGGPAGRIGTLLGVDLQEPRPARSLAAAGAELLTAATHDWQALARQQRALARLHAAALGLPLVRSDWRYGSAIVAGDGSLAADAGLERSRIVLVADVRTGAAATPYARLGDALAWTSLAAAALLLAAGLRRQRAKAQRAP